MFGPEFEIHGLAPSGFSFNYVTCSGAEAPAPRQYDHNDDSWSGEVLILVATALTAPGSAVFEVWEDDSGPCTASGGVIPDMDGPTIQQLSILAGTVIGVLAVPPGTWKIVSAALSTPAVWNVLAAIHQDDFVGRLNVPTHCWPAQFGPRTFSIDNEDGGVEGNASIDFRFAVQRDPICPPSPSILGPGLVQEGSQGSWQAAVTSGVAPFTYAWYRDGAPVGSGTSYTTQVTESFNLRLDVTDSLQRTGSYDLDVQMNTCPPPQITCE